MSAFSSFFTAGTPVATARPKPKPKTLTSLRLGKVFFGEEMKEARRFIGDLADTCKVVVMTLQDLDDTCKVTLMTRKDSKCLPALRLVLYELLAVLMLWYIHQRTGDNNVTHSSTTDKAWRGFIRSTFVSRQKHRFKPPQDVLLLLISHCRVSQLSQILLCFIQLIQRITWVPHMNIKQNLHVQRFTV